MLDVVDQSADFVEVGMKQSCDSLLELEEMEGGLLLVDLS